MASDLPFVNSAYGDNHDRAIMKPLTREDFVEAAVSRGLNSSVANKLYAIGGGPDVIYQTLIDVATEGHSDLVEQCARRLDQCLVQFLDYTLAEPGYDWDDILGRLALGALRPIEQDYVSGQLLSEFLIKRTAQGRVICSSAILSRVILRTGRHIWRVYDDCLTAVATGDYERAKALIANVAPSSPHMLAFRGLIEILVSLHTENEAGLLGIDWPRIRRAGEKLLKPDMPIEHEKVWVETLIRWADVVARDAVQPDKGRLQLDALTFRATQPDVRDLLLFSMSTYLNRVKKLEGPTARMRAVASLPESILQVLAAADCGIDFRKAPANLPVLDYNKFFGADNAFRLPEPGSKLDLTNLLVLVPTLLTHQLRPEHLPLTLCDPDRVRPLQQKLVHRLRNPSAHTIATFTSREADFIIDLCGEWLDAMAALAGYGRAASQPVTISAPTIDELTALLYGE